MSYVCGGDVAPVEVPEAGVPGVDPGCCMGSAMDGPRGCSCWTPVYDADQVEPLVGLPRPTRPRMCGDCAYRPGSPERSGDESYTADAEQLEHLAATGTPFGCHDGMRRVIGWRHPSGAYVAATSTDYYQPPIRGGVPYRADGTPGELCAGWDARRRALAAH